jgi:hypothetical protein
MLNTFSPEDHPQDNTGILHTPYENVSTIVPLHPTCNPIKWEVTPYPPRKEPDQSDQYTREITNTYILILISTLI